MIGFKYDDGGLANAGRKGKAGDCVTRAVCIVTGKPYLEVYKIIADSQKKAGLARSASRGVNRKVLRPIMAELGLRKIKLPPGPRPTWTEAYNRYGNCIVSTTRHLAAIVDGNLRDTTDRRTYEWAEDLYSLTEPSETRERKAASVWVLQ